VAEWALPTLFFLTLSHISLTSLSPFLSLSLSLSLLQTLVLTNVCLEGSRANSVVPKLSLLPHLTALDLSHNALTRTSVLHLSQHLHPSLLSLSLSFGPLRKLGDLDLVQFGSYMVNGSLCSLDVSGNDLDARRFRHVLEGMSASLPPLIAQLETGLLPPSPPSPSVHTMTSASGKEEEESEHKREQERGLVGVSSSPRHSLSPPSLSSSHVRLRGLECLNVSRNPISEGGVNALRDYLMVLWRSLPLFSLRKIVLEHCLLTAAEVPLSTVHFFSQSPASSHTLAVSYSLLGDE
jgi:hypothetical protein